jgi:hypothetical protein
MKKKIGQGNTEAIGQEATMFFSPNNGADHHSLMTEGKKVTLGTNTCI